MVSPNSSSKLNVEKSQLEASFGNIKMFGNEAFHEFKKEQYDSNSRIAKSDSFIIIESDTGFTPLFDVIIGKSS